MEQERNPGLQPSPINYCNKEPALRSLLLRYHHQQPYHKRQGTEQQRTTISELFFFSEETTMMKAARTGYVLGRRVGWNTPNLNAAVVSRSFSAVALPSNSVTNFFAAPRPDRPLRQKHQNQVLQQQFINNSRRWQSTSPLLACEMEDDSVAPVGELFQFPEIDATIVGKTGSIRRHFHPQSNAEAMITCGGEPLAAHASFDPDYGRARDWIRSHPVGPAVLSPVLISGLVGALVEAAFPKSVAIGSTMQFLRPLIVGVEVRAKIEVVAVCKTGGDCVNQEADCLGCGGDQEIHNDVRKRQNGHQVNLRTGVFRINDEVLIAEGTHSIWIPDYLHM